MSSYDDHLVEIGQQNVIEYSDNDMCECGDSFAKHVPSDDGSVYWCAAPGCECMQFTLRIES